ncbi:MAG: hypothetical protein ACYDA9_19795, partial [Terriglobia bacterium]
MPTSSHTDRIALNFLALKFQDFNYQIYRKELGQNEVAVSGTHWLPRDLSPALGQAKASVLERTRYIISLQEIDGYERITLGAWVNPGLTLDVLHRGLDVRCKEADLASWTEHPDKEFRKQIFFVLQRHEEGAREGIWVRAYSLKALGRFGFLVDFRLLMPSDAKISDKRRLELSLTHKNGRLNEDFYLDHYEKLESFLRRYYTLIHNLPLHDGTVVDIERKLSVIRSFALSKRVYIFGGDKEGKSPFFGLRNHGPLQPVPSDIRVVFVFAHNDRAKSQDLFRALRGDTYSTFSGMEKMFGVHFSKRNVSGIEVSGFTNAELQKASMTLRAQYHNERVVPVDLDPMSN